MGKVDELRYELQSAIDSPEPKAQAVICRSVLSGAIDFIYEESNEQRPIQATLLECINSRITENYIHDYDAIQSLHFVRILGSNAEHGRKIRKKDAKTAIMNIDAVLNYLAAKRAGTAKAYIHPAHMTELETRQQYIDLYLGEAGWEVLEKKGVQAAEKASIEIEVKGMPNNQRIGFCDYVLFGRDGKPLAIVEAKKTSVDPVKGRHQVDLYAECMKKVYGYKPDVLHKWLFHQDDRRNISGSRCDGLSHHG